MGPDLVIVGHGVGPRTRTQRCMIRDYYRVGAGRVSAPLHKSASFRTEVKDIVLSVEAVRVALPSVPLAVGDPHHHGGYAAWPPLGATISPSSSLLASRVAGVRSSGGMGHMKERYELITQIYPIMWGCGLDNTRTTVDVSRVPSIRAHQHPPAAGGCFDAQYRVLLPKEHGSKTPDRTPERRRCRSCTYAFVVAIMRSFHRRRVKEG
jgi:hypothetical protein